MLLAAVMAGAVGVAAPMAWSASTQGRARRDAAAKVFPVVRADVEAGRLPLDDAYLWSVRWYSAERALGNTKGAAQDHLGRMRSLEGLATSRARSGIASGTEALAAAYYVAEAELWVGEPPP
jgi:hypothetical protein